MALDTRLSPLAADVARDLQGTPKRLSAQYLYDALGSRLFEAICQLPWYRITRAEERLLARHAPEVVQHLIGGPARAVSIVELGAGSGGKLAQVVRCVPPTLVAGVELVDVSPAALEAAAARLAGFPNVRLTQRPGTYDEGLQALRRSPQDAGRRLMLFLGSNIGNFEPADAAALLHAMRAALAPGDLLLLGADLVKPARELILAYDDPLGVTAAFNKNLLVRLNRELEATFDLGTFQHVARWNQAASRIEMHLASRVAQTVDLPGAGLRLRFAAGETIWTESSHKYTEAGIVRMACEAGFELAEQWIEAEALFALTLFTATGTRR